MRLRLAAAHGEHGVKQQNALLRPARERASARFFARVRFDFFEDIDERRRKLHALTHRKRHSVGLTRAVIGVLTEYHDFHVVVGNAFERRIYLGLGRIDCFLRVFALYRLGKLRKVRLFVFFFKDFVPRVSDNLHFSLRFRREKSLSELSRGKRFFYSGIILA